MKTLATLCLGALLAGCANPPGNPVKPGLKTHTECQASGNPERCKMENSLAGGYPVDLGSRR